MKWINGVRRFSSPVNSVLTRWKYDLAGSRRPSWLSVHPRVAEAVSQGGPVVALETAILTHGLPAPMNLETALRVEDTIHETGALPATVGVLDGKLHVGMDSHQLQRLAAAAQDDKCQKVSRRDIAAVVSGGGHGGTTVSGTMLAAHWTGIPVFVTGGIGGVHRNVHNSLDISADVTELGRTPVAVVCAGVKSILDIGRTLEALETQGVPVVTLGPTQDFPAFFTPKSGHKSPHAVATPLEAARLVDVQLTSNMNSGVLLAVPIPEKYAPEANQVESAIQRAVQEAEMKDDLVGRDVTPFILNRVRQLTSGASVRTNIGLVMNNARLGAKVAVQLAGLRQQHRSFHSHATAGPVVIGTSNIDLTSKLLDPDAEQPLDEAAHPGNLTLTTGGVAKNLADGLCRVFDHHVTFVTVLGDDPFGELMITENQHMDWSSVRRLPATKTATYNAIVTGNGKLLFGVLDGAIFRKVTPKLIQEYEKNGRFDAASMVILDANFPVDVLRYVVDVCKSRNIPLWYEPTDLVKAGRLFYAQDAIAGNCLCQYTSPNLQELFAMHKTLHPDQDVANCVQLPLKEEPDIRTLRNIADVCLQLQPQCSNILVTLGRAGMLFVDKEGSATWYAAFHLPQAKRQSVSGAGDCLVSGVIYGLLQGKSMQESIVLGLRAAIISLCCVEAVPEKLSAESLRDTSNDNLKSRVIYCSSGSGSSLSAEC